MRNHRKFTPALQNLLSLIIAYKLTHDGNSPTVRWLTEQAGVSSTSVTMGRLEALHDLGKIRLHQVTPNDKRRSRAIEVVGGRWVYPGEGTGVGMGVTHV